MSWDQDAHAPYRVGSLMRRNPTFYAIVVFMSVMSGAGAEADAHKTSVDILGQHGLDHPAVHIHMPMLECECKHSHGASTSAFREQGGDASATEASCRGRSEVYWIVSLSGLVAGFVYEFQFQWWFVVEGADKHRHYTWKNNFSTSSSSYTFRQPLSQLRQRTFGLKIDTSVWDACIPMEDPLVVEVTVRDLHPGLTSKEEIIGTRNMNFVSITIRLNCIDFESDDGDESQYNFSFSFLSFIAPRIQYWSSL
jgi:hypothetical protein